uniref:hypothetical protein n=1 Tax=Diaporthe caulivora TaxID=60444 RepID=UPI002410C162|nr:hypothetical protein P8516_mgp23 [Diaporthe caulivora]WEH01731.1 hypothetical protein [Diaporthe caulivora]
MSDSQGGGQNTTVGSPGQNSPASASSSSSDYVVRVGLMESLSIIEDKMFVVDRNITNIKQRINENSILINRYKTCSKIMWYVPKYGAALYDVFTEASLNSKDGASSVLRYEIKLDEHRMEFNELRLKRLDILFRLGEID